ncbi:MAG: phenylacetate--CoA ligase family protein [Deltaproteobacteria bacterium]|nr:phenylacetate--CoA ligase family protein [Deltaproteobacteria bacterium]
MFGIDPYSLPLKLRLKLLGAAIRRRSMTPSGMAEHARRHTAFYRRFYEGHDTGDFESLPVLEKRHVKDVSPYDLLAEPYRDKVVLYGETTGSTGSPTPAFYTREEFRSARVMAFAAPHLDAFRPRRGESRTCLNGLAFGFTIAGMSFGDVLEAAGGLVANVGSRSTLATPPRIARAIARLEPAAVAAAPIDFLSWMRIVREDYPDRYPQVVAGMKLLLSTAELCADSRTRRISEHFGLSHIDVYACVEGFFTLPCTCGSKHILPAYHVELFDEDLKLIGRTGTGRLAFTNLVKKSSPLVRYLLDDWATIRECDCPLGFRLAVVPHGRYELNVPLSGQIANVEQIEECLFRFGLFGDYRIEIHDDRMELTVEQYTDEPVPAQAISAGFAERFGMVTKVAGVPFGTITAYREPRGRKPILKVRDRRSTARQEVPEFL